jgi:AraC-like DNA-binding protein
MFLTFDDRPSPSPLVERVWRSRSSAAGVFHSMAESNIELVVTRLPGQQRVTLRGPVTTPTTVATPADGDWIAIRFRPGVFLPRVPTTWLMDHHTLDLPTSGAGRFWWEGGFWETPTFDSAEQLVERLARTGVVALDDAAKPGLAGDVRALSLRSTQRHFLKAVGMTHARYRQVERARYAVQLLRAGRSIQDSVGEAGYFDQAHMTRAFKALIGQSPLKVLRRDAQLSFLSNTPAPLPG